MRLTHLHVHGLKALRGAVVEVPPLLAIQGPNGTGKTSVLQAIRLGILGHEPTVGKTLAATRQLAPEGEIRIGLTWDTGFVVRRTFGGSLETDVVPPAGERREDTRQARIAAETGAFVPSFDLAAFLDLSPERRRAMLFSLLPYGEATLDETTFRTWLGYDGAEESIRRAIDKLWVDKILFAASPVDGLADALAYVREKALEAERERQAQVSVAAAAEAGAQRATEAETDSEGGVEDTSALQEELARTERTIGEQQARSDEFARADARRRERDRKLADVAARIARADLQLRELASEADAPVPAPSASEVEEARQALQRAREAWDRAEVAREALSVDSAQEEYRRAAGDRELAGRSLADAEKRLRELEAHDTCPLCGSVADLERARASAREAVAAAHSARTAAEEREASVRRALDAARDALEAADRVRDAERDAVRAAESALDEIHRRERAADVARGAQAARAQEAAEIEVRRAGLVELQRQLTEEEIASPPPADAVALAELGALAETLGGRIDRAQRAVEERARVAGHAAAERERADRERKELARRTTRADALKRIQGALQKLRAQVIRDLVSPVAATADEVLRTIDPAKTFRFTFERESRDTFDFGFEQDGVFRGFGAASEGESAILAVAFVAALIASVRPTWRVLLVDNAERVDEHRRRAMLRALSRLVEEGRLDNVLVAGCTRFIPEAGWEVLDARRLASPSATLAGIAP